MEVDLESTTGSNSSFNGKIKLEPDVDRITNINLASPNTLEELLGSTNGQMFIMQLPDTLPGSAPDVEDKEAEGPRVS